MARRDYEIKEKRIKKIKMEREVHEHFMNIGLLV